MCCVAVWYGHFSNPGALQVAPARNCFGRTALVLNNRLGCRCSSRVVAGLYGTAIGTTMALLWMLYTNKQNLQGIFTMLACELVVAPLLAFLALKIKNCYQQGPAVLPI